MNNETTVIICCAGMGTRLGIGLPKALVDIDNKPLIIHLLELFDEFEDVRVVVGYQAEKIIEVVNKYRKDIMFTFNYDYKTTGPAASLTKALVGAKDIVLSIGGDVLIDKENLDKILKCDECIPYTDITSEEPTLIDVQNNEVREIGESGNYEWQGIVKIKRNKLINSNKYIYEMINQNLPMKGIYINSREIDSQEDYDNAIKYYIK